MDNDNDKNIVLKTIIGFLLSVLFLICVLMFGTKDVKNKFFEIPSGSSLGHVADSAKSENLIDSTIFFELTVRLLGDPRDIKFGYYYIEEPISNFYLAKRILKGDFGISQVKLFIPEGETVNGIAERVASIDSSFDKAKFLELAKEKEGYLFPDTYFVSQRISPEDIIKITNENFLKKISSLDPQIKKAGGLDSVIKMASILEKEGKTVEDKKIIAGILLKRLEIGMPLQVDATLSYVFGRNTYELTDSDLKSENPYNTYRYLGLPPAPICNPGIDSIIAVLEPVKSDYLYYVSDREGNFYYAKDFEQHKQNKFKYVK